MTTYLIREMPEGERPRERLKERGAAALSDAELVAILLRTGMKGVAIQLKAAFELARRLSGSSQGKPRIVSSPEEAAAVVREDMRVLDREEFRVLLLNTKNALIKKCEVSRGSLNASIVEPREVFKDAIAASAASMILVHNHPSGDPTPSAEDISVTKRLVKAGDLLNISVLDHIILGRRTDARDQDFVSLKELGLM